MVVGLLLQHLLSPFVGFGLEVDVKGLFVHEVEGARNAIELTQSREVFIEGKGLELLLVFGLQIIVNLVIVSGVVLRLVDFVESLVFGSVFLPSLRFAHYIIALKIKL